MPQSSPHLWQVTTASWQGLTSSWESCWRGRNAASKIVVWSALSFCHSPMSRTTKWVALFSLLNDCNRLSWFSSIASARAITYRNDKLQLGIISQFLSPQQITFGTLLFFFKITWWTLSSTNTAILSNKRDIIHLFTSFFRAMPKVIPNPYGQKIATKISLIGTLFCVYLIKEWLSTICNNISNL